MTTEKEARRLARHIPKEALHQVKTRVGQTNGRWCIHVIDTEAADSRKASTTLYEAGEWLAHPLHKISRERAEDG